MRYLLIFFFLSVQIFSQDLILQGTAEPGGIIFGLAKEAKSIYLNEMELLFDHNDGHFVFGFDRDDSAKYYLKVKFNNGKSVIKSITLKERKFDVQEINNPKKQFSKPAKEDSAQILTERQITKNAKKQIGAVTNALYINGFQRPVTSNRKTGVFGSQRILNGVKSNIHNGIDYGVPKGTPVFATTDGIVRLTADNFYYAGNHVIIDHGQGLYTAYLHLSEIKVKEGELVKKGQVIGLVGTTGRSTGAHLHWMAMWFNKMIDPQNLLLFK